jgi:hypothetical protein
MVIGPVQQMKNRDVYDQLTSLLLDYGAFKPLVGMLVKEEIRGNCALRQGSARVLEMCASQTEGINILSEHLPEIMQLVEGFIKVPEESEISRVKYPGATVLLDLSANEHCIERVAVMMRERGLYEVVIQELETSIARKIPRGSPDKVLFNRYRDLMIGIILNLTCNVEN